MIPYSLYKKNLEYINDDIRFNIDLSSKLFSSRNGYRHYFEIPKELVDIKDTNPTYSYSAQTFISNSRYFYSKYIHNYYIDIIDLSPCGKYVDIEYHKMTNIEVDEYWENVKYDENGNQITPELKTYKKSIKFLKYLSLIMNILNKNEYDDKYEEEVGMCKTVYDDLVKEYNNYWSKLPKFTSDMLICVSTHPYDILGMSTNRRWTSCLNLNTDRNTYNDRYFKQISYNKNIIAYIVDKNDLNIRNPYTRVSLSFGGSSYGIYNNKISKYIAKMLLNKIK